MVKKTFLQSRLIPQEHLLVACLSDLVFETRIVDDAFCQINWDAFYALAEAHSVTSLVYPVLKKLGPVVPESHIRLFRKRCEQAVVFQELANTTLEELRLILTGLGRIVLLQGMALQERVYPPERVRQMGDLDVFFPDCGLEVVGLRLASKGFSRWRHYQNVWKRNGLTLDLHSSLWGDDRIAKRGHIKPFDIDDFEPSTKHAGYHVLSPHDLQLHTAFHSVKHGFSRLVWDVDHALMLKQKGWNWQAFENSGLLGSVIVDRMRYVWGEAVETRSFQALPLGRARLRMLQWIFRHPNTEGAGELALALLHPSWIGFGRYLAASILPGRAVIQEMYGKSCSYPWLIYKRVAALARMAAKGVLS